MEVYKSTLSPHTKYMSRCIIFQCPIWKSLPSYLYLNVCWLFPFFSPLFLLYPLFLPFADFFVEGYWWLDPDVLNTNYFVVGYWRLDPDVLNTNYFVVGYWRLDPDVVDNGLLRPGFPLRLPAEQRPRPRSGDKTGFDGDPGYITPSHGNIRNQGVYFVYLYTYHLYIELIFKITISSTAIIY